MPYPDGLLTEGERVLLHRRPHWSLLAGPVLTFLLTLGAGGYLAGLAQAHDGQRWWWPVIAVVAAGLVGLLTVAPLVRWRTTHLVVTSRRLLLREGVRARRDLEVRLDHVASVHVRRGRVDRLLGRGTLVVAGADGEAEFPDVPDADRVWALLRREA